ncbi:6-phosphogluconate dehydrogenase-like protein NAD-binding protein [Dendryphion nanum]|uniref:6-phosphogluconate dehydrogenase-like protein NAD-binding protein n=1 Tax=Dendryphion nanum TaxID=256645 RepID=A0A9P9ITJ9_9PLEO|nr:6-phosphogluconate dehydrogenase-like protein NAD-binding protein [Dendryphion nanum]
MAKNIQTYLHNNGLAPIQFSNRTLSRGAPLEKLNGKPSSSIAELVQSSDIIFISVSNDEALQDVFKQIISSGSIEGKILVDTTTVHPNTSSNIAAQTQEAGASFIAAPVFGASPVAETGQLLVAVAGPDAAIETISPLLKGVIARNVIHVGSEPSKALLLKTTSNFITGGLMYLISEAHVLAEKSGLPDTVLESLIEQNFGAYAHGVSKRMTQGVYYPADGERPYSDLDLGIKDVGHGVGIAKELGMNLEIGELSLHAMSKAKEYGEEKGRKLDSSSAYGAVRMNAGLDFENRRVKERDDDSMEK